MGHSRAMDGHFYVFSTMAEHGHFELCQIHGRGDGRHSGYILIAKKLWQGNGRFMGGAMVKRW